METPASPTLPEDELVLDWLLAAAEIDALWRHKRGEDVAELMAAFDAVARATSEERKAAVQKSAATYIRLHQARRKDAQPR